MNVELSTQCSASWLPDAKLCKTWLERALELSDSPSECDVSLRFVEAQESNALNLEYRGNDSATNVLSFPAHIPEAITALLPSLPLGDIVICPQVVELEAQQQHKALEHHWAHLLIHGLLHLQGLDHETADEAADMESLEIKILESLGITNPYLVG